MILKFRQCIRKMACSKYEYVKNFELDDRILPNIWIVVRVDGKGFHRFSQKHNFAKPNDERGESRIAFKPPSTTHPLPLLALNLMNHAAIGVMQEYRDIIMAYGESDEYSFVFRKSTDAYKRRQSKLLTYVVSQFTSTYVMNWSKWFPAATDTLQYAPTFDARVVLYPTDENLRDYLSWRQADTHVNNLYNTTFWSLVLHGGLTNQQAEERLRGTLAADKNEILFQEFNINYNQVDPMLRKGTILLRKPVEYATGEKSEDGTVTTLTHQLIVPHYTDLIRDEFWRTHPELLARNPKKLTVDPVNYSECLPPLIKLQIDQSDPHR